jgi:hypothetical protein
VASPVAGLAIPLQPVNSKPVTRVNSATHVLSSAEPVARGPLGRDAHLCSGGPAAEDPTGRSYDEDMFRYFLTLERKRFQRSGRPFLLLLVEWRKPVDSDAPFEPSVAAALFEALWQTIRETDFVGWHRKGRVAGAVLTQPAEGTGTNMSEAVRDRVGEMLCEKLPPQVARRLRVRVYQLPIGVKEQSQLWP